MLYIAHLKCRHEGIHHRSKEYQDSPLVEPSRAFIELEEYAAENNSEDRVSDDVGYDGRVIVFESKKAAFYAAGDLKGYGNRVG